MILYFWIITPVFAWPCREILRQKNVWRIRNKAISGVHITNHLVGLFFLFGCCCWPKNSERCRWRARRCCACALKIIDLYFHNGERSKRKLVDTGEWQRTVNAGSCYLSPVKYGVARLWPHTASRLRWQVRLEQLHFKNCCYLTVRCMSSFAMFALLSPYLKIWLWRCVFVDMRQACVHLAANLNAADRRLTKCTHTGPDKSVDVRFVDFQLGYWTSF